MAKHAKAIVALLTALAVSLSTLVAADSTPGKAITVVLAVLGAAAVYAVPNASSKPPVV